MTAEAATAPELVAVTAAVSSALESRIPEHAQRLDWDADRLAAHQRDRLRELLAAAIERSPFHAPRLRDIDPDTFELGDLPGCR